MCRTNMFCFWLHKTLSGFNLISRVISVVIFLFLELTEDRQIKMIGGLARDYGLHSFRKGNVTSLTSNPDGPPIASIFLRAQ